MAKIARIGSINYYQVTRKSTSSELLKRMYTQYMQINVTVLNHQLHTDSPKQ